MALTIGISGKRIIADSERKAVTKQIEKKIRDIRKQTKTKSFTGYTSLAIGADTIFANVVVNVFKMPLKIILPFPIEEYRKDFTDAQDLLKFDALIRSNPDIEILNQNIPATPDERNEGYFSCGKYMADHCNQMLFVWDGLKPTGRGGTAEILGYYSEKHRLAPLDYIAAHPIEDDPINIEINTQFEFSNDKAMRNRDHYKWIWKLTILLGWLSVLLFAFNTAFDEYLIENTVKEFKLSLVVFEFAFVSLAFILIIMAKIQDYHGVYLSHRLRAEKLRMIRYFYHSDVAMELSADTLQNDEGLSKIIMMINEDKGKNRFQSKWYSNYCIRTLIEEQQKYHYDKMNSLGCHYYELLEKTNIVIASLFMVNLIFHLLEAYSKYQDSASHFFYSHHLVIFVSILLPATYAALEGVLYFQEWGLLRKSSEKAASNLQDALKELPANLEQEIDPNCFEKQALTLNRVLRIMLSDNTNWNLILEDKNNYHWIV